MSEREPLVVDLQQVEDPRVPVMHGDGIFHDPVAEGVGRTVDVAALQATAGCASASPIPGLPPGTGWVVVQPECAFRKWFSGQGGAVVRVVECGGRRPSRAMAMQEPDGMLAWERLERAVEKIRDRLLRSTAAVEAAGRVPVGRSTATVISAEYAGSRFPLNGIGPFETLPPRGMS